MAKKSRLWPKQRIIFYIVGAFLDNLDCIKTMQKYFIFTHKMELGSSSH